MLPEEDTKDVCYQQDQTHVAGEALSILRPADVPVLRDVGQHPSEHHESTGDPRDQLLKHGHSLY